MNESPNRELQRQLREMEDHIVRRLNTIEMNLQTKLNSVIQRIVTPRLVQDNPAFGLRPEPAVPRGYPFGPSNGANRNFVVAVQNANAMGAMNAPMVSRNIGNPNNVENINNLFPRGAAGGFGARPGDLQPMEPGARERRQVGEEETDYEDDDDESVDN